MNTTYGVYTVIIMLFMSGFYVIRNNKMSGSFGRRGNVSLRDIFRKYRVWLIFKYNNSIMVKRSRTEKIDREIYEGLSFLRNMVVIKKESVSSDYIVSQLAQREGILKSAYMEMLSLLRTNKVEEAEMFFTAYTNCESGKEFAAVILSWDSIPPNELLEILISHQAGIKEICVTRQKKRDETISDLIYFPVVMNVFVIFINFIYVSYFMEQKEMFQLLF